MADTIFMGLRATSDVETDDREYNWRTGIMEMFPNGDMPLTGLTALMPAEKTTDPRFHWRTRTFSMQRASGTAGAFIFTNATLATALVADAASAIDTTLYVKILSSAAKEFRVGHAVLLRDSTDYRCDITAKVTAISYYDATYSAVAVRILTADNDQSVTGYDLATADTMLIMGNMNPQGGTRPQAISRGATTFHNFTQIFRDPLEITRTMMETKGRDTNFYEDMKKQSLEQHGIGMEKGFLFGVMYEGTGTNGKPEYMTEGLIHFIRTYGTCQDFSIDPASDYAGKAWIDVGDDWLDEHLEEIFRYGSDQRLALCGSGALLGIQKLVKAKGMMLLEKGQTSWGMNVREWTTPFGQITFKTHPLFSLEATMRNSMVLFEPKNLHYRYISDTFFKPSSSDTASTDSGFDGKQEEWVTECGLEYHFPEASAFLNGIGENNNL